MATSRHQDTSLVLQVLRAVRGWDQSEFAAAAGVSQGTISRYEAGERVKPAVLARLTAAAGLPLPWVESRLLPILRAARKRASTAAARSAAGHPSPPAPDLLPRDQSALADAIRQAIDAVFVDLEADIEAAEAAQAAEVAGAAQRNATSPPAPPPAPAPAPAPASVPPPRPPLCLPAEDRPHLVGRR